LSPLPIVVVAGPTAAGKNELALELAERAGGEIVNADSRQVYRFMDIGTAKPSAEERRRVPHHIYDVVDPDEAFDVARYRDLARPRVAEIASRGRLPIIVGGTGLYLRALLRGLVAAPGAQLGLRHALESLERRAPGTLARFCRRLDPALAGRLHPNDRVRLMRTLEVVLTTGRTMSERQARHAFGETLGEPLLLVVDPGRDELAGRIRERSREMFAAGLVEEVRALESRGYGPELRVLQSIGYSQAWRVLRGEWSEVEAVADLERATLRLAKRQRTWFRAEPEARWIHPQRDRAKAARLVAQLRGGEL
jgi:tRNA dimethylallyltransferase